jgi:hypothetical protein
LSGYDFAELADYERIHGPVGSERLDWLVAYGLWRIAAMLGVIKAGATVNDFLPHWHSDSQPDETPNVTLARLRKAFGE